MCRCLYVGACILAQFMYVVSVCRCLRVVRLGPKDLLWYVIAGFAYVCWVSCAVCSACVCKGLGWSIDVQRMFGITLNVLCVTLLQRIQRTDCMCMLFDGVTLMALLLSLLISNKKCGRFPILKLQGEGIVHWNPVASNHSTENCSSTGGCNLSSARQMDRLEQLEMNSLSPNKSD
jgi:hypothetical protein